MSRRVFLFLQGPSSSLFVKIADRLTEAGHLCLRINLNAGDQLFWRRKGATAYRGKLRDWPAWIARFIARHSVSDMILLGEERPCHARAIEAARAAGVAVYVVEMGYLRPDWVTFERNGMSSNSHFPADPEQILEAAAGLEEPDWTRRFGQSFLSEALHDLTWNLPAVFGSFLFPHYRRHGLYHPLAEYAGWTRRLVTERRREARARAITSRLGSSGHPYFVYPLQLETDYQIRAHSPYNSQREAIAEILGSFARHAAPETRLAIKVHPLDNGLVGWSGIADTLARDLGIGDRVHYLDGGDLGALIEGCRGIVTVNSTAALHALRDGKPARVMGAAIYDIAGMTDRKPLDAFWNDPHRPDPVLTAAFYRLLAASIQVRGNFYSRAGTTAAATAIAGRLLDNSANQPGGYVDEKPRARPSKRHAICAIPAHDSRAGSMGC